MAKARSSTLPVRHHYVRTLCASLLGAFALILISASVLVVWANRTLTDTPVFVQTVGPVIKRPAVQDFVAAQVTSQLLNSTPTANLAQALLPADQVAGKTPVQLQAALEPVIREDVVSLLQSPSVESSWQSTSQTVHAELIRQLNANASEITLDLGPFVQAVLTQLAQTRLAPVASDITLNPHQANVTITGGGLEKLHKAYGWLKAAAPLVIMLALIFAALSVWASVHHIKTLRRMLVTVSVSSLLVAALIALPQIMRPEGNNPGTSGVAIALVGTLLHGLQVDCVIFGIICFAVALGSKLYELRPRA